MGETCHHRLSAPAFTFSDLLRTVNALRQPHSSHITPKNGVVINQYHYTKVLGSIV